MKDAEVSDSTLSIDDSGLIKIPRSTDVEAPRLQDIQSGIAVTNPEGMQQGVICRTKELTLERAAF